MDWVVQAPTQQAALTCERHGMNYALHPARTRLLSLSCAPQQVSSQCGVPALARTLNAILVDHIRALLPSLRVHLEESAERRAKELAVLGDAPPGNTSAARSDIRHQILFPVDVLECSARPVSLRSCPLQIRTPRFGSFDGSCCSCFTPTHA